MPWSGYRRTSTKRCANKQRRVNKANFPFSCKSCCGGGESVWTVQELVCADSENKRKLWARGRQERFDHKVPLNLSWTLGPNKSGLFRRRACLRTQSNKTHAAPEHTGLRRGRGEGNQIKWRQWESSAPSSGLSPRNPVINERRPWRRAKANTGVNVN